MLISVHLPKTAGTSFQQELRAHFGPRLLLDYERPPGRSASSSFARALLACGANAFRRFRGVDCIHGHFQAVKYALSGAIAGATFVTWMREPVERVASNYFHVLRHAGDPLQGGFNRRVVEEKWSLERFCLCPERRNSYSLFLRGVPLRWFSFIGITEHYDSELDYFAARYLAAPVRHDRVNFNPNRSGEPYITDPDLRRRIEAYHRKDVALYRQALAMRAARLAESETPGAAPLTVA